MTKLRKTLILIGILVCLTVTAAPPASAGPVCDMFEDPPNACVLGDAAVDYGKCFLSERPILRWGDCL